MLFCPNNVSWKVNLGTCILGTLQHPPALCGPWRRACGLFVPGVVNQLAGTAMAAEPIYPP